MDSKEFGQFISGLRKEMNYTQKQVAEKIHVTDKAISKWENGKGLPDISNIEALADVYSVSVGELMQCKRYMENKLNKEDAKEIVDHTLDIVHYQEQLRNYKRLTTMFFGVLGMILILAGLYFMHNPFSVMLSGNNGSASLFVAGKIPLFSCWIALLTGVVCIIAGMIQTRSN